jgi:hypothetical protein
MKIFLVLLALLLVLFAVGIGLGARDDSGRKADPVEFGWLDSLTRPFRPTVETGALRGSCLSGRTATIGSTGPCEIEIEPADEEVRTLELVLERGGEVKVDFAPEAGGLDIHAKLHSDRSVRLSVPRDGAELTLVCAGSSESCGVRLD